MSLYHHLKTWLGKKREHPHEEETVAVPEIHTGKVAHHVDADGTPAADKPIQEDKKTLKRINKLLQELQRDGAVQGIGKAELLR